MTVYRKIYTFFSFAIIDSCQGEFFIYMMFSVYVDWKCEDCLLKKMLIVYCITSHLRKKTAQKKMLLVHKSTGKSKESRQCQSVTESSEVMSMLQDYITLFLEKKKKKVWRAIIITLTSENYYLRHQINDSNRQSVPTRCNKLLKIV